MKHPAWSQYLLLFPLPPYNVAFESRHQANTAFSHQQADVKQAQFSGINSNIVRGRGGGNKELIDRFISFSHDCLKNNIFKNKRYTDEVSIF